MLVVRTDYCTPLVLRTDPVLEYTYCCVYLPLEVLPHWFQLLGVPYPIPIL